MRYTVTLLLMCLTLSVQVASGKSLVNIKGLRIWTAPDKTRLVFDLSAPIEHSLFTLKHPDRLVIDLKRARLRGKLPSLDLAKSEIRRIRYARHRRHDLRIVLDLKEAVRPKSFLLKPNREYGNRLVIDLADAASKPPAPLTVQNSIGHPRDIVVAIDPGHGGEDPGATGPDGIHEKTVVLAIAKRLAALIARQPGMKPFLTRTGDYYVSLRDRRREARAHHADLFISIHADSYPNPRARGATVYILSTHGASSEAARWLAHSENASDLIGGVSLSDKSNLLASVLLNLSQNATIEASHEAAKAVMLDLGKVVMLHKSRVGRANFVVLRSPDIPSMLVETSFISNRRGERELASAWYQRRLAKAIMAGVLDYFDSNPPPGTYLAERERKHIITRGETLSYIAQHYQVSVNALKNTNNLHTNRLRVGDVLRIPPVNSDS